MEIIVSKREQHLKDRNAKHHFVDALINQARKSKLHENNGDEEEKRKDTPFPVGLDEGKQFYAMCHLCGELSSTGGDNYTYLHVYSWKSDKKTDKKAE